MTRVAAIDLGTNSSRLLLAQADGGNVEAIERRTTVTALGRGVDATRTLSPEGIARVYATLEEYQSAIAEFGAERTLAVATSAVRDAANGREFLRGVSERFGFETQLVSGDEEAALTLRGVGAIDPATLVLDVGGGSTELITAAWRTSLELGSVRLTERHLHSDPPAPAELASAAAEARSLLPELDVTAAIGVAGTVEQLQALAPELTLEAIERLLARLAALPLAERREFPGLLPARAPVIVGGAIVVCEVLRRYGLARIAFSERDLLDGVAAELADRKLADASE